MQIIDTTLREFEKTNSQKDKDNVLENPSLYIKCSKDAEERISDTTNITNDWLTR